MKMTALILLLSAALGMAQEDFVPPESYPMDRYEPAWKKNPFTLKTAPVAIEKISFAKDLALGAVYQIGDDTTVVVVNTKTRERFKLVNDQLSSAGIKVKAVFQKDSRKETYVEVEAGGEAATLRYNENYQKQMVGQQQTPNAPQNTPPPIVTAQNNGAVTNVPPPMNATNYQPAPGGGGNAGSSSNRPPQPRIPGMNGSAPGSTVPTPQRRRLLTAPVAPAPR